MSWFIELPQPTIVAIGGIVLAVLGLLIQWVSAYIPWLGSFLEQFKFEWGVALSAALVAWMQNALPGGELAGISTLAVQLVVALVLYGLAKVGLASRGVAGFKR